MLGFALTLGCTGAPAGGSVSSGVCEVVGCGVADVGVPTGPTTLPPAAPPAPLHIAVTPTMAAERRIFVFIRQNIFEITNFRILHCCPAGGVFALLLLLGTLTVPRTLTVPFGLTTVPFG